MSVMSYKAAGDQSSDRNSTRRRTVQCWQCSVLVHLAGCISLSACCATHFRCVAGYCGHGSSPPSFAVRMCIRRGAKTREAGVFQELGQAGYGLGAASADLLQARSRDALCRRLQRDLDDIRFVAELRSPF